jgi:hypothetical protein
MLVASVFGALREHFLSRRSTRLKITIDADIAAADVFHWNNLRADFTRFHLSSGSLSQ